MSYDEKLAERIRKVLKATQGVAEKKMFGGLAFMLNGSMFCGVNKDDLVVRLGPERYEAALNAPGARPMDFTGRVLTGYVYVAPAGCQNIRALEQWVRWGLGYASEMPEKKSRVKKPQKGKMK
ncbi:MAG: TfoX/Sxy family protein [Acidobacteria bacterium]|nr:TfoX/Sxy family protein [Acidobacteriota bacterium]